MSELEQQIHEIDLICADLHDRLIALDALKGGMGASMAGSLIQVFDQILQKSIDHRTGSPLVSTAALVSSRMRD